MLEAVKLAITGPVVSFFKYIPTDSFSLVIILPSFWAVKVFVPVTLAYIPTDFSFSTSIDFPALFLNVVMSSPYIPAALLPVIVIVPSLIASLPVPFA